MSFFKLALLITVFSVSSLAAQQVKTALDYLNFIGDEQKVISKNMWSYTKAIAHSRSDRSVVGRRKALIKSLERAILKIENTKTNHFDGDQYKSKVLQYLNFNKDLLNEDYAKIIDMKAVAEQSYDAMEAYIMTQRLTDEKMKESQQQYENNFNAFAAEHNIEIIENQSDLSKKMAISNAVFEDYNNMYLIFFKVYINEVYLIEALDRKDVSAIRQNINSLNDSAKEGIEILSQVNSYKNDPSLVEVTKNAFHFFINEAQNQMPTLVDFLITSEEIEKLSEVIEKTPKRKRTKEQVNTFNKKVKTYNKMVKSYNKINEKLNKDRQNILNKLNAANDAFLAKHIPKD